MYQVNQKTVGKHLIYDQNIKMKNDKTIINKFNKLIIITFKIAILVVLLFSLNP